MASASWPSLTVSTAKRSASRPRDTARDTFSSSSIRRIRMGGERSFAVPDEDWMKMKLNFLHPAESVLQHGDACLVTQIHIMFTCQINIPLIKKPSLRNPHEEVFPTQTACPDHSGGCRAGLDFDLVCRRFAPPTRMMPAWKSASRRSNGNSTSWRATPRARTCRPTLPRCPRFCGQREPTCRS